MNTIPDLPARVEKGVAYLDEHHRDGQQWVENIDLGELRLRDSCRCVLGQLYGTYYAGVDHLLIGELQAEHYGFVLQTQDPIHWWRRLDELWIAAIKARLNP